MDIVVTLPKGDLEHLDEKIESFYSYWEMARKPKSLSKEDKVFIACAGFIRGYFTIRSFDKHEEGFDIAFEEWQPIKLIPMKGFQGFRYRKFGYKVV